MGSVHCYYSGIESGQHFQQCLNADVDRVLTSFWQFHNKDRSFVSKRKKKHPHVNFMIDSGAHTFITEYLKFMNWTQKQFENYVEDYVKWLVDNRRYITAAVELDIDHTLNMVLAGNMNSTLGTSLVADWQRKLFRPLRKKGIDIIYVWHEPRGIEGWEDMCAMYDYVGLPGELSSKPDFNKFVSIARRYSTRIHGFAATKQLDFRDVPWFSIDSITWKTGEMYGTLIDWDERSQKLSIYDKQDRPLLRQKMRNLGFDADGIINDVNYKEVTRYSLHSMRRMEKFYAERAKNRLQYYELRLPYMTVIDKMDAHEIQKWWERFRADVIFTQHAAIKDVARLREYLVGLSSAQNADTSYFGARKQSLEFLKCYFPKLVDPFPSDLRILQREVAVYTAPPNPPALMRTEPEHWEPAIASPKKRDEEFDVDDLRFEPPENHYLASLL